MDTQTLRRERLDTWRDRHDNRREIDDLERTKAVMVNETARKAIDLHIENLRREIRRLEE